MRIDRPQPAARVLSAIGCLAAVLAAGPVLAAAPSASNVTIQLTPDYRHVVGSAEFSDAEGGPEFFSTYRWIVDGTTFVQGVVAEGLQLNFDGSVAGASGEAASASNAVGFSAGRWGSALELATNGYLKYSRAGNLLLDEGCVELWLAPRANGNDAVYTSRAHTVFHYLSTNNEDCAISQSGSSGILYAGGSVSSQWQSAYGALGNTRGWLSEQWHHVLYTFSSPSNFMRLYVDGRLTADTNEGHYWPPASNGVSFAVGCNSWNEVALYNLDALRISGRVPDESEIAARAQRTDPPKPNEIWLDTSNLPTGAVVSFEFTPCDGVETGAPVASGSITWNGEPIVAVSPASTLLAPGTTSLMFSAYTRVNSSCRYSLSNCLPYAAMTAFDSGAGTTQHEVRVDSFDPSPVSVNHLYVRCSPETNYVMHQIYRCVPNPNPPFPRIGNLWGWDNFLGKPLEETARISLWLGADDMSADTLRQLRALNTNTVALISINAVEWWNEGIPEDYYLHDTNGVRLLAWPPQSYRLNLTKTNVAEFLARQAYQKIVDGGLAFDGCFFDNVFLSHSWADTDIYGNPFVSDFDEDGLPDDPAAYDAAWKAGVLHELQTFRALMPNAIASCHAVDLYEPGITNTFNAISIGFETANVLEREQSFQEVYRNYVDWMTLPRAPRLTMLESSPLDDIAYGYDYSPDTYIPTSTLAFAQSYYPIVRFGLALTLMQDGYFAHEYGDTWHGNAWWYDELDFNLGYPLGPAKRLSQAGTNRVLNFGFEQILGSEWGMWANAASGCTASYSRLTGTMPEGTGAVQITVTSASGNAGEIEFRQFDRALESNTAFEMAFWARAEPPRYLGLGTYKGSAPWTGYGLNANVQIDTNWTEYSVLFNANATVSDARLQFFVGSCTGQVWLDEVRLRTTGPDLYSREFDNGLVILNGSWEPQSLDVGPGYRRLVGNQAPRHEYIVDDADVGFSVTGVWNCVTNDSGEWTATGPFYHDWGASCRESSVGGSTARWALRVPDTDVYTVKAWWPATPSNSYSTQVRYDIVTGGVVAVSATLDQQAQGDEWNLVGSTTIATGTEAWVEATALTADPWIADAIYVTSAARYNDGTAVTNVVLQPMDGIILRRQVGWYADRDHDGLPDFWEFLYFGDVTNAVAWGNPDGDGHDNLQEWLAGSDPTNAASVLRLDARWLSLVEGLELTWLSVSDRWYDLEYSTNLLVGFGVLTGGLWATPPLNIYTDMPPSESPHGFYRIRARR